MLKPQNYDNAPVQGEMERPEVGGHHMIIKQVVESQTKTGKDMLVVYFDFAQNDRQPDLFTKNYKSDIRPDKKWPRRGTQYITVLDNEGNTSRSYKTFCSCFEKSNGVEINWTNDSAKWCGQFKNKKIGGAFGIVHSVYNGKDIAPIELRWFVTDSNVDPENVPKEKELSEEDKKKLGTSGQFEPAVSATEDFMKIAESDQDALPFN